MEWRPLGHKGRVSYPRKTWKHGLSSHREMSEEQAPRSLSHCPHLTLPDLLCITSYSAFFPQPSVLVIPFPDSLSSPPEVPQDPVIEGFLPGWTQPP